jgi:hypothetical protein
MQDQIADIPGIWLGRATLDLGERKIEMVTLVASVQLIAVAGLIFLMAVLSWRAGDRFWSSR